MVTLLDGFRTAVDALLASSDALAAAQLNLTNATAPGYARLSVGAMSDRLDFSGGLSGGVRSGSLQSARNQYAEHAVWTQSSQKGFFAGFTQASAGLGPILGLNDVSGQSGIPGALAALFRSFAQLQQGPHEPANQEAVVHEARNLALTISEAADYLQQSAAMARSQIQDSVSRINGLVSTIRQFNAQLNAAGGQDPAAEAQVYTALESLSELAPITVQKGADGGLTILLNGQIPLLQGAQQFPLSLGSAAPESGDAFPDASVQLRVLNASGEDITAVLGGGKLGGLIDYTNRLVPSLLGDASQQGDLNRLAQSIAEAVNAALGGPTPLFEYGASPTDVARSLKMADAFTAADIAAAIGGNPGVPASLTQIINGSSPANQVDGLPFTEFFRRLASGAAGDLTAKNDGLNLQIQLLSNAQALRDRVQGITLEEAAVELLQYQRSFEAAAKVIGVVDELLETTLNMV